MYSISHVVANIIPEAQIILLPDQVSFTTSSVASIWQTTAKLVIIGKVLIPHTEIKSGVAIMDAIHNQKLTFCCRPGPTSEYSAAFIVIMKP